jgi:DNA-binding NarL/FixJ family response regulator
MRLCLICDDHALVRDAVAGLVRRRWPEAEILQAADFPTAWALAARGAGLCIVDLNMPGAPPLEGVGGVMAAAPDARLLVLTGQDDDALMLDLLRLGVAGFASKTLEPAVLAAAIELVAAGGRYLPPRLAELGPLAPAPARTAAKSPLTERQLSVLRLMARGQANKQIARELELSPATVKTHVATLIAVLGASNRTEAVARARTQGLV